MLDDVQKAVLIVLFIPSVERDGEIGIVVDGNYIAIRNFEVEP